MENEFATLQYRQRYREALDHLQAGRWNEAIAGFEAMLQDYPDDIRLQQVIEKARLNASFDGKTRIHIRRWQIAWRTILFRTFAALTILAVLVVGVWLVTTGVLPALAEARIARQQTQLLNQGITYLAAADLDRAEANFSALLAQVPNSVEAQRGLSDVHFQREIQNLYQQAVQAQDQQDFVKAQLLLNELALKSPGYRDINIRLANISQQVKIDTLFAEAEATFNTGQNQVALAKYLEIRTLNDTYQINLIDERLFTLYVRMGRALVEQQPPVPADIPQALDYFNQALALVPRDPGTMQEKTLADLFTKAQNAYQAGRWHDVTIPLRAVYDSKPDYLGTVVLTMLYDAYIRSGDLYLQEKDPYRAYDDYYNASRLPVPDPTLAIGRLTEILKTITVTPTPKALPTNTATTVATPAPPSTTVAGGGGVVQRTPTPIPSPTPYSLAIYRNRIIFRSLNPGQTGLWVTDPDGNNRQYLGNSLELARAYDDLQQQYEFSPDRSSIVFVLGPNDSAQIYLTATDAAGGTTTRQLTNTRGASYDPAWSPDGKRIVYVSEDTGSDDIWTMAPDGSNALDLTPNKDYDKHPSWSPDNLSITFWSSRAGLQQIFVMSADGKNVTNISNSPWDEFDPIWVR